MIDRPAAERARAHLRANMPHTFVAVRDHDIEHVSHYPDRAGAERAAVLYATAEAPECGPFDDVAQAVDVLQGDPALYVEPTSAPLGEEETARQTTRT